MRMEGKSVHVDPQGSEGRVIPPRRRIAVLSCPCALKRLILWNCHAAFGTSLYVQRTCGIFGGPGAYEYYAYAACAAATHKQTRQRNNIQFYAKVLHNKITSANWRTKSVKSQRKKQDQQIEPLIHLRIIFGIKIAWHKRSPLRRPPSWNIFLISASERKYFCDFRTAIAGILPNPAESWILSPGAAAQHEI